MPRLLPLAVAATLAAFTPAASPQSAPISFAKEIQPIFETSCWKCHGGAIQLSKLDLRTREAALKGGVHGPSITPGKPEVSKLYRMVAGLEKPPMPMDGKLKPEQIDAIKRWIAEGAVWDAVAPTTSAAPAVDLEGGDVPAEARQYWAFRKPVRHPVPVTANARINRHPVDAFLMKTLADRGLKPAPAADAVTLVRRAYMDLTGLPPTPSEVSAFLSDREPDAWERLIDRLLASPHYGERWGRHWLDVARYADSNGFEHDFDRPNAWRYRDYVIQSFNRDTPYNVFLREQIAGDELDWVSKDSLIATGFLRNYAKVGFREKDNPEFRYEYLDDMIATVGRGVLGMTVQCARCHNHKFDPIPQKDYYRLQAALWGYVEVDHPLTSPEVAAEYSKKLADVNQRLDVVKAKLRDLEAPYKGPLLAVKYKKFPQNVQDAIATPEDKRTPGQLLLAGQIIRTVGVSSAEIDRVMTAEHLATKKALLAEMRDIEKDRPAPIPVAMGITDGDYRFTPDGPGDEPAPGKGVKNDGIKGTYLHSGPGRYEAPPSYFLIRGDIASRGSLMQPGFLTVATEGKPVTAIPPANGHTAGRRRALAEWLVSRDNPLTSRVMVNRIWHHHFGRGIAATLDNFGKMGEKPTHPELLDWLAVEFMDRGWSIKQMHRLLMTSEAYKMSSAWTDPANVERDPMNAYGWRFRSRRLEAEIVRDAVLAVSGGLNREFGGPAVFPQLQPEVLMQMKHGIWRNEEDGPKVWRRSVYIYRKRGLPFPMLESFDLPDQNISCGARPVSTAPTQALMLMNDEFVVKQAELFAKRVAEAEPKDASRQVELAYKLALSRAPQEQERALALDHIAKHGLNGLAHVLLNLNEFVYLR